MASRPRSARALGALLAAAALCSCACRRSAAPEGPVQAAPAASRDVFEDETSASGLDFRHFNGATGKLWIAEMMGAGCALLDADGDGDLDLYLVQGSGLDSTPPERCLFPPRPEDLPLGGRFYRNDLEVRADGTRVVHFIDVTAASGVGATAASGGGAARGYGMGAAVGDYDDDGRPDLYLTNLGPNVLLRNRGDGTFEDVTARSGAADPRWRATPRAGRLFHSESRRLFPMETLALSQQPTTVPLLRPVNCTGRSSFPKSFPTRRRSRPRHFIQPRPVRRIS